jgi:hypothetical protein
MFRSITRAALLFICLAAMNGSNRLAVSQQAPVAPAIAARTYYPEARMRKMHLVRPDLILYPIFYDIYC